MDVLPRIAAWLNIPANALGKLLLAPLSVLPGWLSVRNGITRSTATGISGLILLGLGVLLQRVAGRRTTKSNAFFLRCEVTGNLPDC